MKRFLLLYFCISFATLICAQTQGATAEDVTSCLIQYGFEPSQIVIQQSSANSSTINNNSSSTNSTFSYDDFNYQWQLHGGILKPIGYLIPTTSTQVQSAVICCRKFNFTLIPKSGGHSYGKYSFGDYKHQSKDASTFILDLQQLNQVKLLENRTNVASVGSGTLTGHMAIKLWQADKKMLPIGICPTVGIGGLALGGGHGYLSRTYGLMMDNIIEMEVVDQAGRLLTANNESNSDLFWALRGAGANTFGIVTSFIFKIHPAPLQVIYLINVYKLEDFSIVFDSWQRFVESNKWNSITTALHVKEGSIRLEVVAFQTPEDTKFSSDYVLKLFKLSFPSTSSLSPNTTTTIATSIELQNYPQFLLKMAHQFGMITKPPIVELTDILNISRHSFGTSYMRAKSFYGKKLINSSQDLDKLSVEVQKIPNTTVLYYLSYGGLINDYTWAETSFIHRGSKILYHCEMVQYGSLEDDTNGFPWLENFFKTTQAVMNHDESYQNYIDDLLPNYLVRYYGENLKKLIRIKQKYDPDNYFHTPLSIPLSENGGGETEGAMTGGANGGNMMKNNYNYVLGSLTLLLICIGFM